MRTQSRHVTLTAPTAAEKALDNDDDDDDDDDDVIDIGMLISAHSHTSRTHTVETTTVCPTSTDSCYIIGSRPGGKLPKSGNGAL